MTAHRALITGATGYVGSNLVAGLLRDGWNVSAVIRPSSSTTSISDVIDQIGVYEVSGDDHAIDHVIETVRPDVVMHVAACVTNEHLPDEIETLIESNITFGTLLLEAMARHGVTRFVNTGTHWEHFNKKAYSPVNLYAATKHAFRDVLQYYVEAKGIHAITLELFDPYGPHDPRPKLLNLLLKAGLTGEELAMSPGDQEIDLVHIDDVVKAYRIAAMRLLAGDGEGHEVYGVASGRRITLKELVNIVEDQMQVSLNIEWGGRKYRSREAMKMYDGYSILPGWAAETTLEAGLKGLLSSRGGQ